MSHLNRNFSRNVPGSNLTEKRRPFERNKGSNTKQQITSPIMPASPIGSQSNDALMRQNQELRDRLQEEASLYRRRLDTYRQAQQNQAALVSRLQTKVLQYKQKCNELENRMPDSPGMPIDIRAFGGPQSSSSHAPPMSLPCHLPSTDRVNESKPYPCTVDNVFHTLESDKQRIDHLLARNEFLRQQLEESHRTNVSLTNDFQKITIDWDHMRSELAHKENEWKEEEQAFNDYYNSEHNRLSEMMHEVGSLRRTFKDLQSSVRSDLHNVQQEINTTNRDINSVAGMLIARVRQATQAEENDRIQSEKIIHDLQSQIDSLKSMNENLKHELGQREQRLQNAVIDLRSLENRCVEAENQAAHNIRLNDEIDRLLSALREIAHVVVHDSEAAITANADINHLHLSQALGKNLKSPKQCGGGGGPKTSQAFAEGTVSAVQAVLHRYQLVIHDLQVENQSTSDELLAMRKKIESCENARELLTAKLMELTEKLDITNNKFSELCKERDSLQRSLDGIRNEKHLIEKDKTELNFMVNNLQNDCEKLQSDKGHLQKIIDAINEEKKLLEIDLQCLMKDKDMTEMNLRAEETRSSSLREEVLMLREELNKLYLTKDLLDQQRIEAEEMLAISDKQRGDIEHQLEQLHHESAGVRNQLEKSSTSNTGIVEEIKNLQTTLHDLEADRERYRSTCDDQQNDIGSLKKELLAAEQIRLDLESERHNLSEKLKVCHMNKEKIELDLNQLLRERSDLTNQLTCMANKRDQLGEELTRIQQRLEQSNEMNSRLNRNIEDLTRENGEKGILIESLEKEIQRQQEHFAALRSEKEALDGILFDANTNLEASQNRCEQLDKEVHDSIANQEKLKSRINQLRKDLENCERHGQEIKLQMTNALNNQESEFAQKIAYLKNLGEENYKKWTDEREQIKNAAETQLHGALQALESSKNADIYNLKERLDALQHQFESTIEQHEEVLIRAENEKQQALLLAHRDKQVVIDKLEQAQQNIKTETENLGRLRRETAARIDRDRIIIKQLNDDLAKLRAKSDEQKLRLEENIKKLDLELSSVSAERDVALKDVENTKSQLKLIEDKVENLSMQLQENLRKLKESDLNNESIRKELIDVRRSLAESNIERDKYMNTNKELRDHVKRVESHRREQSRSLDEAISKLTNLEESKSALENDRTRIATLLKEAQTNLSKLNHEHQTAQCHLQKAQQSVGKKDVIETELQARLNNECEERERIGQEMHQLKKQLSEIDEALQNTRQELGRARCKAKQDEHRWYTREQELLSRLEDGKGREKCLEDQKHNLEVCLADATQQIQEFKARIGASEGRVRSLEEQLGQMESCKKDIEHKLTSVLYTLKRIAGIQFDGTLSVPHRLMSPSRRYSPARSEYGNECCLVDFDPEMIRKSVRKLMQQIAQIEREKDEYNSQLQAANKRLDDMSNHKSKLDNKISKLQQALNAMNEDKANIESKLVQKQHALQSVEETLKLKTDDFNLLSDKYKSLESQMNSILEQRNQLEDRIEKARQHETHLEMEKRHLQEELSRCENRASKLDLQRIALEGDIQRLQMAFQDKDNQIRNVQERLENQCRSTAQIEDRCIALKTSVDQLKERLQSSAITETELRSELSCLQKDHVEHSHTINSNQDKLKHLQKALSNCDNEKRILHERFESAQNMIKELQLNHHGLQDNSQRLQNRISELEVQKSTLEAQMRIYKTNPTSDEIVPESYNDLTSQLLKCQREKNEFRLKIEMLNERLRKSEIEQFGKSTGTEIDSNRLYDSGLSGKDQTNYKLEYSLLKQENHDLKIKIRRLETLLAEKESELARLRASLIDNYKSHSQDRSSQLLDTREQHHRQQVTQLENQISMLKEQLAQESKRRQQYLLRSARAGREMQQLRHTLGDSLRHIASDPVDPELLANETRRLDTAVTMSLPSTTGQYNYGHNY